MYNLLETISIEKITISHHWTEKWFAFMNCENSKRQHYDWMWLSILAKNVNHSLSCLC